jgi:hypothetical protein
MINVAYPVIVDGTKNVDLTQDIYEGQPVALNSDGILVPAKGNVSVYGLAFAPVNRYRNYAYGEYGAFGSAKLAVVKGGIVNLGSDIYDVGNLETITIKLWTDDVENAAPGTELYINNDGKITTDNTNANSNFGKVVLPPSKNNGILQAVVYLK